MHFYCHLFIFLFVTIAKGESVTIMTFNAEWLFISNKEESMIPCPGPSCPWKTQPDAHRHLEKVARMIQIEGPDIVHMDEVGDENVLRLLISLIGPIKDGKTYKAHFIKNNDSITGQNSCLLSLLPPKGTIFQEEAHLLTKYPISSSKCALSPFTGKGGQTQASKHYGINFIIGSTEILLVGIHLLAHPNDPKQCPKREGQAKGMREFALRNLAPDTKLIIIGDMNDYDNDVESPSPTTINLTLSTLKGGDDDDNSDGGPTLVNVAQWIPNTSDRFTTTSRGNVKNLVDHILLDPSLDVGSVKIMNSPTDWQRWGCGEAFKERLSDHYPLQVRIDNL